MPAIPALRVRLGVLALLTSAAFVSTRASASGIYIPENGTEVLSEGGADVGLLDTAYSLQFNPAGMAFVNGLDVHVDMNMTSPGEWFTDQGASKIVANGASTKVSNTGGISLGPQVMAVYHPPNFHWMAFGLGVWGPPGVINYSFPDPRTACCSTPAASASAVNAATAATPQRYEAISQSTLVVYPTLGVAVRPIPQIAFGATLQYVISDIQLATALQGLPAEFSSNPNSVTNDVIASVNTTGKPRFTTTLGLVISPIQNLMIAGSFQPMIPIDATGTLGLELGNQVSSFAQVSPKAPSANLQIKLPPVVRAGVSYKWRRLTSSIEYVWEGWSVNNQYTLSTNAQVYVPLLQESTPVGTVNIPNNWTDTSSIRVGFGYDFFRPASDGFGLHGNLGFLWDQNAIPQDWQKVPFITGTTFGPTIGAGASWHGVGLNVGFAYYIPQSFTVTDSKVAKPVTPAPGQTSAPAPIYIGDGTYTTNVWVFSVGLSYSGFGA